MAPAQVWREMRPGKGTQWMLVESWMIPREVWLWLVWRMRVLWVVAVKRNITDKERLSGSLMVFDRHFQRQDLVWLIIDN